MRYLICLMLFCFILPTTQAQNLAKDSIAKKSLFDATHKLDSINLDSAKFAQKAIRLSLLQKITIYSSKKDTTIRKDSLVLKKKHDPHKATLRSAIIPGWGQAYNREYWKIPLVYAAIGIPIGTFIYNNTWYKRTRDAYVIVVNGQTQNYNQIDKRLYYEGQPLDANSLQNYRNQFRKDRDYSILVLLFAWGLNVVDATVFGHLKDFDVSSDLSMRVQPDYDATFKTTSLGFVFNFKTRQHKEIPIP